MFSCPVAAIATVLCLITADVLNILATDQVRRVVRRVGAVIMIRSLCSWSMLYSQKTPLSILCSAYLPVSSVSPIHT